MKAIKYLLVLTLLATSCKKEAQQFNGSLIQLEQSWEKHTVNYVSTGLDTLFLHFSIIGKPFEADQHVSLKYDSLFTELASKGIVTADSSLTFPADSYYVNLPIIINTDSLKELSSKTFSVEILQNGTVSENYKNTTVTIYRQGLIDVFRGNYYCSESGYSNKYLVALEYTFPVSDTILIKNFWDFSTASTRIQFVIQRTSDLSIDMPAQTFTDRQGTVYTVEGTGTYEPSGAFMIDYTLTKKGSNTVFEKGNQKYTPIR